MCSIHIQKRDQYFMIIISSFTVYLTQIRALPSTHLNQQLVMPVQILWEKCYSMHNLSFQIAQVDIFNLLSLNLYGCFRSCSSLPHFVKCCFWRIYTVLRNTAQNVDYLESCLLFSSTAIINLSKKQVHFPIISKLHIYTYKCAYKLRLENI